MKKIILLISILALFLVIIWFRDGLILGVAEDGLIFYNISNYYHQAEYTWMEYPGLGSPSLSLIAGKPTYFILSMLQNLGVPGFIIQGGVLWFLIITAATGVLFLSKELFPKLPNKYIFLSIAFYLFSPITLVDVWNRFLLNYIFFFSLLPIGTYFYIKGLRTHKYYWVLILNIALFFLSYAFSYIAFILLFWIWIVITSLYFALFSKNKKISIFILKYFLLNIGVFFIIYNWWILPLIFSYISGAATPTANLFSNQSNQLLLDALSKTAGNLNGIFKLINSTFLSTDSLSWVRIYYSFFLYIVQYFFMGAIFFLIIKKKKNSTILFLGSLFITVIFLSKGNNPPLGGIYNLIYSNVLILQVFRNPFEKFGFILSLLSSILLGPSLFEINNILSKKLKSIFYATISVIIFLFLGIPLYSGLAFTNKVAPTNDYSVGYRVKVPPYYKLVDEWLKNKGTNFRYIGLPLKDEGITYKWEKGYAGADLTVSLFSGSGILLNTSTPFFNQIVPRIEQTLLSEEDFSKIANLVNARFYLLRYDIDYKLRGMTDPEIIEKVLREREKKGEVKKMAIFGKVEIWENLKWKDTMFYVASKVIGLENYNDLSNLAKIDVLKGEILLSDDGRRKVESIIQQKGNSLPEISYKKVNSTKYIVHIKGATKPFFLSFSELYNNGWEASLGDGRILDNHIQANIFGNGWSVDKIGEFDISLVYGPQKWMYLGEKISTASYILIVCSLLFLRIKRKI